jgi:polysaccharide deacetylase family protein (PEP-CTERM system associated)
VEANTFRLLDLFDSLDAKATFFVLGWVANRFPALIREIALRGHELACHSYWHRTVYSLTPEVFREDTVSAIRAIEDAGGVRVKGYRAPTWSITNDSLWALRIMAEVGIEYDSSIFPIHHDLYGIPGAYPHPYRLNSGEQVLMEVPPATISLGKFKLPAAGGGYLRIFPLLYTRFAIERFSKVGQPAVIYLHPWEIDPEQPRLNGSRRSRFRQYFGLRSLEAKLSSLLTSYRFTTFERQWRELSTRCPTIPMPTA